jgi:pseudouridine synthase
LQKVLAASGLASRREAERLIVSGQVTVNGRTVRVLGTRVDPQQDEVRVDGEPVRPVEKKIYLLMYKPRSVLSTADDPQQRTTIMDLLGGVASARGARRVFHVGRLDYASEGLLLLTNDGKLAHDLAHPSRQVPRVYHARVRGAPRRATLTQLRGGVDLEDGPARAVEVQTLRHNPRSTWLEVTLVEGRNRMVRRLLEAVGHPVQRLIRVSYGGVELGEMKPGQVRELTRRELQLLRAWPGKRTSPMERV